jgi:hypothetical protein
MYTDFIKRLSSFKFTTIKGQSYLYRFMGIVQKFFPFMNQLANELEQQGLEVIGINLDKEIEEANQFLHQTPVSFTIAKDADQK